MKLNQKGIISAGTSLVVLMITSVLLIVLYSNTSNTTKVISKYHKNTEEYVQKANTKERLYSALNENYSLLGSFEYADLNTKYNVNTLNENFDKKNIKSDGYPLSFNLKNKTDITVKTVANKISPDVTCNYSIQLTNNGKDMLEGLGANLSSGYTFTIDSDEVYDTKTQKSHLGKYDLNVNSSNCVISIDIEYQKLTTREIEVDGDSIRMKVLFEDNNDNPVFKIKKGGF